MTTVKGFTLYFLGLARRLHILVHIIPNKFVPTPQKNHLVDTPAHGHSPHPLDLRLQNNIQWGCQFQTEDCILEPHTKKQHPLMMAHHLDSHSRMMHDVILGCQHR